MEILLGEAVAVGGRLRPDRGDARHGVRWMGGNWKSLKRGMKGTGLAMVQPTKGVAGGGMRFRAVKGTGSQALARKGRPQAWGLLMEWCVGPNRLHSPFVLILMITKHIEAIWY